MLECVHEILFLRGDGDNLLRAAREISITPDGLKQFIDVGEPKNAQQVRYYHILLSYIIIVSI